MKPGSKTNVKIFSIGLGKVAANVLLVNVVKTNAIMIHRVESVKVPCAMVTTPGATTTRQLKGPTQILMKRMKILKVAVIV